MRAERQRRAALISRLQVQSLITCKCAALMKPSGITFKSRNLEFWTGTTNAAVLALFLCEKTF